MLFGILSEFNWFGTWSTCHANSMAKQNRANAIFWICLIFLVTYHYFRKLLQVFSSQCYNSILFSVSLSLNREILALCVFIEFHCVTRSACAEFNWLELLLFRFSHICELHESHTLRGISPFDTYGIAVFILLLLYFYTYIRRIIWPIVYILSKTASTTIAATKICYFSRRNNGAHSSIQSISFWSHSMSSICCMCWTNRIFRTQSTSFLHAPSWFVLIFTGNRRGSSSINENDHFLSPHLPFPFWILYRLEYFSVMFNILLALIYIFSDGLRLICWHMPEKNVRSFRVCVTLKLLLWSFVFLILLPFKFLMPTLFGRKFYLWLNSFFLLWYGSCVWNSVSFCFVDKKLYNMVHCALNNNNDKWLNGTSAAIM